MTAIPVPNSSNFTISHQQFPGEPTVDINAFRDHLDDAGIERIIAQGPGPAPGRTLTTSVTIGSSDITFHSYAYESAAGILNIWTEATWRINGVIRIAANARASWNHSANPDSSHNEDLLRLLHHAEAHEPEVKP